MERLNTLRAQQLPAVDAACRRLEGVLQGDAYLQQRLCRVTVEAHSKALYSLHKCAGKGIHRPCGSYCWMHRHVLGVACAWPAAVPRCLGWGRPSVSSQR